MADAAKENEEKKKKFEAEKLKKSYMTMKRDVGSGPVRIGTKIRMTNDIYSMYFASNLKPEYIYYCQETNSEKDDVKTEKKLGTTI